MKIKKFKKIINMELKPKNYAKCYYEYKEIIDFLENKIKKLEKENFVLKNENKELFKILNNIRKERM